MPLSPLRIVPALLLGAAALAPRSAPAAAPDPACVADFDSVRTVVSRDYAGYQGRAYENRAAMAAFTDSVRAQVRDAGDAAGCTAALRRWLAFFPDNHLQLSDPPSPAPTPAAAASAPSASADTRLPSLRWAGDSTAVLRLPSFGQRYKGAVDSLVAAHRARLLATPRLVIDLRGNGGGWTGVYSGVIPLLYTGPIRQEGMDAWASEGNVAYARRMLESERTPEGIRSQLRTLLPAMEEAVGGWVTIAPDGETRLDTVFPLPRAVAVVVDRACASTCEQFVLDARQSRKVTVLGSANTRGMLDYGNARTIELPSGRRLFMPTARSRRLPHNSLDATGLAPRVRIPPGEPDAVEFALRWLRTAGPRPESP